MKTIPMRVRNAYVDGLGDGAAEAERDLRDGWATDGEAQHARDEARASVARVFDESTRVHAAYDLGYARGYRGVI